MLPNVDGLSLTRELRARCAVPILMLSARGEEVDRVVGLEMGADDYWSSHSAPASCSPGCGRCYAGARECRLPRSRKALVSAPIASIERPDACSPAQLMWVSPGLSST